MVNNKEIIKESVKSVELEKRYNAFICEWGTKHGEKNIGEETNRTYFRRQRDRILYTGGFRRLQYKTQVIAATKSGDHRTRLTHSLEVEQISTSIADALGLNRDLVAAISIGHDIGHTPFGHAVEKFLNDKLEGKGGFSHAVQSVRYLKDKGVELSNEVYEGILKHDTDVYSGAYDEKQLDCTKLNPKEPGNLETQVVYWSDKLAYITHDLEDFLQSEIYKDRKKHAPKIEQKLKETLSKLIPEKEKEIMKDIRRFKTRDLIRNMLRNLIEESLKTLNQLAESNNPLTPNIVKKETKKRICEVEKKLSIDDAKKNNELKKQKKIKKRAYQDGLIINFDKNYREAYLELRNILDEYYIGSPQVQILDAKATKIVEVLYNEFNENPKILPLIIQDKIKDDNQERIIADYIASMTDKYAEEVFVNLNSISSYYEY